MISDDERDRRRQSVDQARASVRLEGTILPAAVEEINARFVVGEISAAEYVASVLAYADTVARRAVVDEWSASAAQEIFRKR